MAPRRVSVFAGFLPLVPGQGEALIRLPRSWGIQRLCWIGRRLLGVCEARCGNGREGWIVQLLGRPIVGTRRKFEARKGSESHQHT